MIEVLNRHRLKYNISDDRDFNSLIERILVSNSNDPEVQKYLQRDKCEVGVQTESYKEQGMSAEQIADIVEQVSSIK